MALGLLRSTRGAVEGVVSTLVAARASAVAALAWVAQASLRVGRGVYRDAN
jgi:hypothetical protein